MRKSEIIKKAIIVFSILLITAGCSKDSTGPTQPKNTSSWSSLGTGISGGENYVTSLSV